MHHALARLTAATPGETDQYISYTLRADGHERHAFYASISTDVWGLGNTPDAAVRDATQKYGTQETRRAATLAKLQEEAAKLGMIILKSPSEEHAAQA